MSSARITATLLFVLAACAPAEPAVSTDASATPRARSVVLFTIDTLRADRLTPYGYAGHETPAAARLAAESLVFDAAYSQADNTNPAMTSMLTGLVPPRHGVFLQVTGPRDEVIPLAAMLSAQGFKTASFVANLCKLQGVEGSVFAEGWDETFCGMDSGRPQREWGQACVDAGLAWIAERQQADEPFFAWIHLMDPHSEYDPSPSHWDHRADPLRRKIPQLRYYSAFEETGAPPPKPDLDRLNALYDAEVRGSDDQLGRMLDGLEALDRQSPLPGGDDLALIFSADHGEELYETWHRIGHGFSLTEGVLRVPLMIRAPGVEPGRVGIPVETLALTPTILGLLGAEAPYALDGHSLFAGPPDRPFARSYTWPLVVTVRSQAARSWVRQSKKPVTRDFVGWRLEAPWFEQPYCSARYDQANPNQPRWISREELAQDEGVRRLHAAARVTLGEVADDELELNEITDPAYLQQLIELGYIEGPGR